ncbi:MAG: hypothetical protein EP315_01785 [Gammaproteobacteria bacterium]|nr:MAG: hypothetical protein EP315_01785 [Gammaproteobacteria bacterium]
MTTFMNKSFIAFALLVSALFTQAAQANLASDIQNLNTEASALKTYMAGINLNADAVCGPLLQANNMARDLINSITHVSDSLAAPLQVDADVLTALDSLFVTGTGIANEALSLSVDVNALSTTANALTIKDGITAMLQLSDDIGTMADRIGEMADKILVMSDNIGLMADRILVTQELQNQNVALTTRSILQTQTNMLTLVSIFETASYDVTFDSLLVQGELLAARMMAVAFNPFTMDDQLRAVAADVNLYLQQIKTANDALSADSAANTAYITSDTLIKLANLPLMLTSLATAIDGYVIAIEGLQAVTTKPNLYDSLKSMLALSADIGVMANRILEMGDTILAMADNIGLQADQILATQSAMNVSIASTQTSILGAQEMAIGMIAFWNLD